MLFSAARLTALFGGAVLCGMAATMTISVFGRYFLDAPVPGDFELIALGTGIAVFSFLPYCQITGNNVVVDFFLSRASPRTRGVFDALGGLLFGVLVTLLAWRTGAGGIDAYESGEATVILDLEFWPLFPYAVACLILLAAVCLYTGSVSLRAARTKRDGPA